MRHRYKKLKAMVGAFFHGRIPLLTPLLLLLALAIACGAAATATPAPTATKPPVAPAATAAPAAPATTAPAAPKAPVATIAPTATSVPVAKPKSTPAPTTPPRAKVERLRVALIPGEENNDPHGAAGTALVPLRLIYEYVVEVDRNTGGYIPMLATEWKMRPDGKAWTVKLRKGIPWHRGYGEFTAQDIAHTYKRLTRDGSLSTLTSYWRANLDRIEVVNDQEAVYYLKRAEAEWYHQVSTFWDGVMISKAQFEKDGQEGFAAKPVGTGPYQFVERRLGVSVRLERVPYAHWRVQPDFKEVELLVVREEVTRQAMLLTGEVHIAEDIPMDIQGPVIAKGIKAVRSTIPSGGYVGQFGGNYLPSKPSYDPKIPWTNKKVRQALNLAINRQEIIDTLFAGKYEPIVAPFAHRTHPEFKAEWVENFKQNYGYNPEKAKQLLREAGYPQGFKTTIQLHTQPGAARQDAVAEAVGLYWRAIGVDAKLENIDQSNHVSAMRGETKQGKAWVQQAVYRPPWNRIQIFNTLTGVVHGFESEFIEQKWKELGETVDPDKRTQIQREVIDYLLEEYAHFPIVWVFAEFMIDPKVVAEYVTAGITGASHLEYVKAAR